jgi:hypothetical protein
MQMPLALVLGKLGDAARAAATAESVIDCFKALGSTGLNLALAYETRARVALEAGDHALFESHARLAAEQLPSGSSRLLSSKFDRAREASRASISSAPSSGRVVAASEFSAVLKACASSTERARCGLEMLVRSSGAVGGALYTKSGERLTRSLQAGLFRSDATLDALAQRYFQSESAEEDVSGSLLGPHGFSTAACEWRGSGKQRYVPVLLSHQPAQGFAVTGLAVLVVELGGHFTYPGRIAEEFSRVTLEHGDAAATYL